MASSLSEIERAELVDFYKPSTQYHVDLEVEPDDFGYSRKPESDNLLETATMAGYQGSSWSPHVEHSALNTLLSLLIGQLSNVRFRVSLYLSVVIVMTSANLSAIAMGDFPGALAAPMLVGLAAAALVGLAFVILIFKET